VVIGEACSVGTVRALEAAAIERLGDEDILMQLAAAGLAAAVARELAELRGRVYGTRVLVMVGPGNNGGDALFAGARLARRGVAVTAVRCLGYPHARGLAALLAAGGRVLGLDELGLRAEPVDAPFDRLRAHGRRPEPRLDFDLAIDGVLGIGGRPGLPQPVADLASALWDSGPIPIVAVDLPSGVGADTGAVPGAAIEARRTVTFGVPKFCHLLEPARSRCGAIEVVDIGLRPYTREARHARLWLQQADEDELAICWPYPDARSDKYSRGVVGVHAGSDQYPGAGMLATTGAVYGGAGMVRFLGTDKPAELIRRQLPNVVFSPGRVQANLLGSGWGEQVDGREEIAAAVDSGLPTVVDADGLTFLPERCPDNWLLTPHAGELAKLLGEERAWVTEDPIRAVRAGADRTGATVLLKGASQLVADPENDTMIRVAVPGPAWTGQAGSGDVLGGICAALLAAGRRPEMAALLGASVQAYAASRHPGPVPPQQLAEHLPETIAALQRRARAIDDEIAHTGW
jgi:ADP-dependent NAD(P)H-hydrate dehydratase / NAD(P)H-hydrate epimerase